NFYPTWSPDGKWVAFASAPVGSPGGSFNQEKARLRLVASDGGKVYELAKTTQGSGHTSTWPKFAPFVQRQGTLLFITFNSKIDYGFFLKNDSLAVDQRTPQLWMVGIDTEKLGASDASYAPMWLPMQDVTQNNHLGYWAEKIPCSALG